MNIGTRIYMNARNMDDPKKGVNICNILLNAIPYEFLFTLNF